MKAIIGSAEAMKSANINDSETLTIVASDAAKLMAILRDVSLKRARGKPRNSIVKLCPIITPYQFGSFSDDGSTAVKPNRFLCANISIIWATTALGD